MIRILHVGLSSNQGGIETVVKHWMEYIPDDVIFDFINTETKPLAYEDYFRKKGATIYSISSRKKNPIKSKTELERIIRKGDYDYVHCHVMSFSWIDAALYAIKAEKTKAIIHSHMVVDDSLNRKYKFLHMIGKRRLEGKEYYKLACGNEAGRSMFGLERFTIIENGIDFRKFRFSKEKRNSIRNKLGISDEKIVIGHVGRNGAQKNYPFILKCFHELVNYDRTNAALLLIGNIDKDNDVQNLIDKYGIREKVICTGIVNNVEDYYSAMDVFFFPSLYEGFSVSLVEAQVSGLPCIVSNRVAKESSVSDLVTFIDIGDCRQATEMLSMISSCYQSRSDIEIDEKYDLKNCSKKMFDFYYMCAK